MRSTEPHNFVDACGRRKLTNWQRMPRGSPTSAEENARYAGVLFGSVRGAADMHDGAFVFHPLRVYDGDASLSLEGSVRFRREPGRPTLDVEVGAVMGYRVSQGLDLIPQVAQQPIAVQAVCVRTSLSETLCQA